MSYDPYPDISLDAAPSLSRPVLLEWGTVRTALGQIAFGAMLLAIGWLIAAVISLLGGPVFGNAFGGPVGGRRAGGDLLAGVLGDIAAMLLGLLMIMGAGLVLVGFLTCCGAPYGFGVRGWIVAAVFSVVVFLGLLVQNYFVTRLDMQDAMNQPQQRFDPNLGMMVPVAPRPPPQVNKPNTFGELMQKATPYLLKVIALLIGVFFLLFLRQTAVASRKNQQHIHVLVFLAMYLAITLTYAILDILNIRMPEFKLVYVTIILIGMSLLTAWFAVLTGCVRGVLTRMMLTA